MIRDDLAAFAVGTTIDQLPAPVVKEVKRLFLDHVGSLLSGPHVIDRLEDLTDLNELT